MDFARQLIKSMKDDVDTSIVSDAISAAEFANYIDTGSYTLNALLSGTIYGGMPDNRTVQFAGESQTGKTFFVLGLIRSFLAKNPKGVVLYYDSERAVNKQMMEDRGIDSEQVIKVEKQTIDDVKTHIFRMVENYQKYEDDEREPVLVVLDSYGALASAKELGDIVKKKDGEATKKDMTKQGEGRALFRAITMKLAKAHIPFAFTNHTYTDIMTYGAPQTPSGGGGPKYYSDITIMLSVKPYRDETDKKFKVLGDLIKMKVHKGRFTKKHLSAETVVNHVTGLDRYYGLLPIGLAAGVFVKEKQGYSLNQERFSEKEILADPETYYTKEVLDKIDEFVKREFKYGSGTVFDSSDEGSEEESAENQD